MARDDETPEEKKAREELEGHCVAIGTALAEVCPPNVGFTLMMYDFGERGAMTYMSNAKREDMLKAMREFLETVQ